MSCCGNKRNEYAGKLSSGYSSQLPIHPVKIAGDIFFEYTGKTVLSVTGSVTGKKYRFSGKGDIQLIDYRDVGGMMAIPVLAKIR